MLSFLYVYSDHSILECYNLFSGVELSMRSFFVIFGYFWDISLEFRLSYLISINWVLAILLDLRDFALFRSTGLL